MEAPARRETLRHIGWLTVISLLAVGCRNDVRTGVLSEKPVGRAAVINAPLGLPPIAFPPDNPPTAETIMLGRRLFYETKLSKDNTVSCAFCHNPALGFTDGRKVSLGVGGKAGARNAPSILNTGYGSIQFWDGRAATLEDQSAGPMANAVEMNQTHDVSVSKLNADPAYRARFAAAFGPGPATLGKIKKALASFERTVISGNSPFDRYRFGGNRSALSPSAVRGLALFTDEKKGNCSACHTIEKTYALFSDGKFHNIGIGVNGDGEIIDLGRFSETKRPSDRGAFKTPSLRNVAKSAPYMHDGSLKTLADVVEFYNGGGNSNPHLDPKIKPFNLTSRERDDLVAFLESLTGEMPAGAGPPPKD